jgi:hypothetical protein
MKMGFSWRVCGFHLRWLLWLLLSAQSVFAQVAAPHLHIERTGPTAGLPVQLTSSVQSNVLFVLQGSPDVRSWQTIGTFHDGLFRYPDLTSAGAKQRYYRLAASRRGPNDDWKNQVLFPVDSFRSTNDATGVGWVKFAILLNDPARVYFEDSKKFPFHYDFARQRLGPFLGMDYPSFEAVSLHRTNQQVILGTLLYPPTSDEVFWMGGIAEYGVQLDGLDAYAPEEIARWMKLVQSSVYSSNVATALYMPSFEQSEMARTNAEAFASLGITVSTVDRWGAVDTSYAKGWALGRLKFFPAADIVAAFSDGRLQPNDILLTDGVPADTPLVAGIISLTPGTPNSHTALLCRSFGVPFVYLSEASAQERARALDGHEIVLRVTTAWQGDQVTLIDAEDLPLVLEADLLRFKQPEPIEYPPKQRCGALSTSADLLGPGDISCFGGKAANYGVLRRCLPANSPVAIAFSFDLWDAFLDQVLSTGKTLSSEIASRLATYTNDLPDLVSLKSDLQQIRDLFTKSATFTPAQKQTILAALTGFEPRRKLRFRSSTNVEDTEHFTGAGLYDSYSGCLLDELDANDSGPSQCDPLEPSERGVFRAIQKVYASFYKDNAFLERHLHHVEEAQVAMGLLVHYSFPDEDELANGVATPTIDFLTQSFTGDLVTQVGADSVTNPDGRSLPEIVGLDGYGMGAGLSRKQGSSLLPLGASVLDWPREYQRLSEWFRAVATGFQQVYPNKTKLYLDFEYKKDRNLGLQIKQVRQVPPPAATISGAPFLLDDAGRFEISQYGSVFASHRLKSTWTLHTANLRLVSTNLAASLYSTASVEYLENGSARMLTGAISTWPNSAVAPSGTAFSWRTGSGVDLRSWNLAATVRTTVGVSDPPILTLSDFYQWLSVSYTTPAPVVRWGVITNTTSDFALLQRRSTGLETALLQTRSLVITNRMNIQTRYFWPKPPGGLIPLSTPLLRFDQTIIAGLTTAPIVLTNYYSQSYGALNHNYFEEFLFEPGLEPGLSPATLEELKAANIQQIYVSAAAGRTTFAYLIGMDQTFRAP